MTETRDIILKEVTATLSRMAAFGLPHVADAEQITQMIAPDATTETVPPCLDFQIDEPGFGGMTFERFGWAGLTNPQGPSTLDKTIVQHCTVQSASHWSSRVYGVNGLTYSHMAFLGTEREHDIYPNLNGGKTHYLALRGGFSRNAGGQLVQTVQRESEGSDLTPGGLILVEDWFGTNPGSNFTHGRNSFAFSFFDGQKWDKSHVPGSHDLIMRRAIVDKSMQEKSTGFLLIQSRPHAAVSHHVYLGGEMTQPLVKVEGEGEVCILQHFITRVTGGQNWIDVSPGWEKVWINDWRSDAHVHREGKDLGPASEIKGFL